MPFARTVLGLVLAFSLCSCAEKKNEIRHYREIVIEPPPHAHQTAAPEMQAPAKVNLAWTCPEGWVEQPGQNMRLATFLVGPDKAECTIVSFPGDAGGVMANVKRWMGQLKIDASDTTLGEFLKTQPSITTQGGLPCTIFDFTQLPVDNQGPSMLAGMAAAGGQTVFVKLMGPAALLATEKDHFVKLCESLEVKE